jgi:hypothetical protein
MGYSVRITEDGAGASSINEKRNGKRIDVDGEAFVAFRKCSCVSLAL